MLTQEQERKVKQAIAETNSLIKKEEKYSLCFQKKNYLKSLYTHLDKLNKMLMPGFVWVIN
jgi:hypothetical protein